MKKMRIMALVLALLMLASALAGCNTRTLEQQAEDKKRDSDVVGILQQDNITEEDLRQEDQFDDQKGGLKDDEPGAPDILGTWTYVKSVKDGQEFQDLSLSDSGRGFRVEFTDMRTVHQNTRGRETTGLYRWDGSGFYCCNGVYGRYVYIDENNIKRVGNGVEHFFVRVGEVPEAPDIAGTWVYEYSIAKEGETVNTTGQAPGTQYTDWMMNNEEDGPATMTFTPYDARKQEETGLTGDMTDSFNGETFRGQYKWDGAYYVGLGDCDLDQIKALDATHLQSIGWESDHYYVKQS